MGNIYKKPIQSNKIVQPIKQQRIQNKQKIQYFQQQVEQDQRQYEQEQPHPNIQIKQAIIISTPKVEQPTQMYLKPDNIRKQNDCISIRSEQTHTIKSVYNFEQNVENDKMERLLKDLVIESIPFSEVNGIKQKERRRILILWLKQGAGGMKQNERDKILLDYGFELYSTSSLSNLIDRYEQGKKQLRLSYIILFSYSDGYNNEQTIKQLYEYFVIGGRALKLMIIKPSNQQNYRMLFNNIKINRCILQYSYQIEYIKYRLIEYMVSQYYNSCNFINLRYWDNRQYLLQIYYHTSIIQSFLTKCKISLITILKLGQIIIDQLEQNHYFKYFLKKYAVFHDLYLTKSLLMKQINVQQNYLKRIGMRLLQDPINFYMNPSHQLIINKILKYSCDNPEYLSNIILPLSLIYYKIRQQYKKQNISKRYRNQFVCYYQMIMTQQDLNYYQPQNIIQNLGFIKASLKYYDANKILDHTANVLLVIHIQPIERDSQYDNGYYFIGQNHKDVTQEQQNQSENLQPYTYILINLMNTFIVINKTYDSSIKKYIIQLQYGYIPAEIQKRTYVNFIGDQIPRYIKKKQDQPVNYQAIIKFQSNQRILNTVTDIGDCFTLLRRYNDAIAYYSNIFAKCRSQVKEDVTLLSKFQNKKGINCELAKNSESALEYFYNAFNFIRKTKRPSDIEINVLKCLLNMKQYQKVINFGENLLNIAKRHHFLNQLSPEFLLEFYGLLARACQLINTIDYQLKNNQKQILKYYNLGLKVLEQIGQYCQAAPKFYFSLGRYYLSIRLTVEALAYFSKSLLIKMTMLTEQHPDLCLEYQMLSIVYICMHDYSLALKSIKCAQNLYKLYFGQQYYNLIIVYEIKGKILSLMNNIQQANNNFELQLQLLRKRQYKITGNNNIKRFIINNNIIALMNLFQQKIFISFIKSNYKKSKSEICQVYIIIYQSYLFKIHYQYAKSYQILTIAIKLNYQQSGESNILNIEMYFLAADLQIQQFNWSNAKNYLKSAINLLNRIRKTPEQEIRYYELYAKVYEYNKDYQGSIKQLSKAKTIAYRGYGKESLENCRLASKMGKIFSIMGKFSQAKDCFKQYQEAIPIMIFQAKSDPKSTGKFGVDFDVYMQDLKILLIEARLHGGILDEMQQLYDLAIGKYRDGIENYKDMIGQCNNQVIFAFYRIGRCYYRKGVDFYEKSMKEIKTGLSIYKQLNGDDFVLKVEMHVLLTKIYELRNQHISAIQQLIKILKFLRERCKIGYDYLNILKEINRFCGIILSYQTVNGLKNTYFIIGKIFEGQDVYIAKTQYEKQVKNQLADISKKWQEIRSIIESNQASQQVQERQLKDRLQQKQNNISLDKIKQNIEIRKKLRLKNK